MKNISESINIIIEELVDPTKYLRDINWGK